MSKKPPVVKIGRIIIRTPEENAAADARAIKALNARNKATNKVALGTKKDVNFCSAKNNPAQPARPGSEAALSLPSRIGDHLHYRDGRVLPFPL